MIDDLDLGSKTRPDHWLVAMRVKGSEDDGLLGRGIRFGSVDGAVKFQVIRGNQRFWFMWGIEELAEWMEE